MKYIKRCGEVGVGDGRTDRPANARGFTAKPDVLILFASLRVVVSPGK